MAYGQPSEGAPKGLSEDNDVHSESDVELANRLGRFAAILGLAAFGLRVCFAFLPPMTGVGQLVGLVMGLPAMVIGIIALAKPGSHRMATVGIVFGALAAAIGVGTAA